MFETFWDDDVMHLWFQYADGNVFAHCQVKQWSKSKAIKIKDVWEAAKEELVEDGYKDVFVVIPEGDNKLLKFEKMFGFKEIGRHKGKIVLAQHLRS